MESILILDSPDDGYKLFTREELKRLPDKIFESPTKPSLMHEIGENLTEDSDELNKHQNIIRIQNMKIVSEGDSKILTPAKDEAPKEAQIEVGKMTKQGVNCEKKIWEFEPKDINFDILIAQINQGNLSCNDPTKSTELEKHSKEIIIANEDAAIFEEMDMFIKEINMKNSKESAVVKIRENLDHNYCLQHSDFNRDYVGLIQSNAGVLENRYLPKPEILSENNTETCKYNDKTNKTNKKETQNEIGIVDVKVSDENIAMSPVEKKKYDILEKLVSKSEINVEKIEEMQANSYFPIKYHTPNVMPVISEQSVHRKEETCKFVDKEGEVKIFREMTSTGKKIGILESATHLSESETYRDTEKINFIEDYVQLLKDVSKNLTETEISTKNTNQIDQIQKYDYSENFKDALNSSKACKQYDANESAILVIKEDGFLEPINLDSTELNIEPHTSYEGDVNENRSEKNTLDEEARKITDHYINREVILALLEKAKSFQYSQNNNLAINDKIDKEKLERVANFFKEHITTSKELYEKLEINTQLIMEELGSIFTIEQLKTVRDNLNFIENILQKSFTKEEKKDLKYKVVRITMKNVGETKIDSTASKPVTKKVYCKKAMPKNVKGISNSVLRRTLLRMDKLLDVIEKNRMTLNTRRNTFVFKARQMDKKEFGKKRMCEKCKLLNNKSSSNNEKKDNPESSKTEEKQILKGNENIDLDTSNSSSLAAILEQSDGVTQVDKENVKEKEIRKISPQGDSFASLSFDNNKEGRSNENPVNFKETFDSPTLEANKKLGKYNKNCTRCL